MHHGDQYVFVIADAEEARPQGDVDGQVECAPRGGLERVVQPGRRPLRRVDNVPAEIGTRRGDYDLLRGAVGCGEQRTQALVPADDVGQRGPQGIDVQRTVDPQGRRHVVDRRGALHLVDEPQPVLCERQRHDVRPLRHGERLQTALAGDDARRQLGDGRCLEHGADRKVDVQRGIDRRDQPHGRQRVAAEIEERIVDAHPFDAEHLRVDAGQDLLGDAARCPVHARNVFRLR
ncbi:Uncharacterised protein [Mycobacteroides abscessus subsp. abscessus]|nr:Uncharacterised protein [Mycobacteroides abscessus subsp. abscessus]